MVIMPPTKKNGAPWKECKKRRPNETKPQNIIAQPWRLSNAAAGSAPAPQLRDPGTAQPGNRYSPSPPAPGGWGRNCLGVPTGSPWRSCPNSPLEWIGTNRIVRSWAPAGQQQPHRDNRYTNPDTIPRHSRACHTSPMDLPTSVPPDASFRRCLPNTKRSWLGWCNPDRLRN